MTKDQRTYIHELIEAHVSKPNEILRALRLKWPDDRISESETNKIRKDYLMDRLGSNVYTDRKLTAFQIFDRGGGIDDVMHETGASITVTTGYFHAWNMLRSTQSGSTRGEQRKEQRFHALSGAVFGRETSRETIWKQ